MPLDNVEIVRRAISAFNRGDLDAAMADWDPDIEWHQITAFPDRAVFRGPSEVRARLFEAQLFDQLEGFQVEPEEFVEVGDHVILIGHIDGRGRGSGLRLRMRIVWLAKLREGRIVWVYDCSGESRKP